MNKLILFILATLILTSCGWKWESSEKLTGFTVGEVTSIGDGYDIDRNYVVVDTNRDGRADIQCRNSFANGPMGVKITTCIGKSVDVAIWSDSTSTRYQATLRE